MIQDFNFLETKWVDTGYNSLKEYVEKFPWDVKIRNTNQHDFNNVYLYHFDDMGHTYWIRMPIDDFKKERNILEGEKE